MAKVTKTCEFCRHWYVERPTTVETAPARECRRFPPVIATEYANGKGRWLRTYRQEWCGEWESA